jgi:hypothetical protein
VRWYMAQECLAPLAPVVAGAQQLVEQQDLEHSLTSTSLRQIFTSAQCSTTAIWALFVHVASIASLCRYGCAEDLLQLTMIANVRPLNTFDR